MNLLEKKCIPCEGGVPSLTLQQAEKLLKEIPKWSLTLDGKLFREFKFKNFAENMKFVNKVARLSKK